MSREDQRERRRAREEGQTDKARRQRQGVEGRKRSGKISTRGRYSNNYVEARGSKGKDGKGGKRQKQPGSGRREMQAGGEGGGGGPISQARPGLGSRCWAGGPPAQCSLLHLSVHRSCPQSSTPSGWQGLPRTLPTWPLRMSGEGRRWRKQLQGINNPPAQP